MCVRLHSRHQEADCVYYGRFTPDAVVAVGIRVRTSELRLGSWRSSREGILCGLEGHLSQGYKGFTPFGNEWPGGARAERGSSLTPRPVNGCTGSTNSLEVFQKSSEWALSLSGEKSRKQPAFISAGTAGGGFLKAIGCIDRIYIEGTLHPPFRPSPPRLPA